MRKISATVPNQSLLVAVAMRRQPAGGRCQICDDKGWVRAVVELPFEILCPACDGQVA